MIDYYLKTHCQLYTLQSLILEENDTIQMSELLHVADKIAWDEQWLNFNIMQISRSLYSGLLHVHSGSLPMPSMPSLSLHLLPVVTGVALEGREPCVGVLGSGEGLRG